MKNSIEEITFVKNEIKDTRILFEEVGCYTFLDEDLCKAIEHILSDYKRVLKENEELLEVKVSASAHNRILELEKENEELKNKLLDTLEGQKVIKEETPQYIKENYISKEKVKDKIEELKNNPLKIKQNDKYYFETHAYNKIIIGVLQELIEEREEK